MLITQVTRTYRIKCDRCTATTETANDEQEAIAYALACGFQKFGKQKIYCAPCAEFLEQHLTWWHSQDDEP